MTRDQGYRYEMLVRVRDFGAAHTELFPASSTGGQKFAQVKTAVAAIEAHMKDHVLGTAHARRVKTATRAAFFDYMKIIAHAGRRVARRDAVANPFRIPRKRTLATELAAARVFIEEAEKRQDDFVGLGMPPTFISDFRALVDRLQQATDVRLSSKTMRREALPASIRTLLRGFNTVCDLDVVVAVTTREDPTTFAAWQSARRIEGQRRRRSTAKTAQVGMVNAAAPPPVAPGAGVEAASPIADAAPAAAAARPTALPLPVDVLGRAS